MNERTRLSLYKGVKTASVQTCLQGERLKWHMLVLSARLLEYLLQRSPQTVAIHFTKGGCSRQSFSYSTTLLKSTHCVMIGDVKLLEYIAAIGFFETSCQVDQLMNALMTLRPDLPKTCSKAL